MKNFIATQMPSLKECIWQSGYSYEELSPTVGLDDAVHSYWRVTSRETRTDGCYVNLIPDGCVNLVIDFQQPTVEKSIFLLGPLTGCLPYRVEGSLNLFGIRIMPGRISKALGIPAKPIVNRQVLLEDVFPKLSTYIPKNLDGIELNVIENMVDKYVADYIEDRILHLQDEAVEATLMYIYEQKGQISIQHLAEKVHYSPRTLTRRFEACIGISPKHYCRIVRFQYALQDLQQVHLCDWTEFAVDHGYYDQAHLIKEFKEFAGFLPTVLCKKGNLQR